MLYACAPDCCRSLDDVRAARLVKRVAEGTVNLCKYTILARGGYVLNRRKLL